MKEVTNIYRRNRAGLARVALVLFSGGILAAQSITLSPSAPSVATGATVQFMATVTGASSAGLVWYAGGVPGGNSTYGSITNGLYTAPAVVPSPSSVRISAVSADGTASGKTTVTVIAAGPAITSVSPNPLPSGTITVTINGTGFQTGATVFDGAVQMSTTSLTANSITATGYQSPAASTAFCVKNPGTSCGNSLTVPVTGASSGGSSSSSSSAPTLTSVSPYPLSVGTITVTIAGSGFQAGALVYDSYGNQTNIQSAPTTVTANSITVTIYQGPAATSTFSVKNPGSGYSNAITVPVTSNTSGGSGGSSGGSSGGGGSIAAPTLTSVTPNPLSVGTITVTIAGSGFQTGALVYDSYGSQSNIQTAPTTVTANSITVTIYQGPAATSTFSVKNPGSGYSNTITVPVTSSTSGGSGGSSGGSSGGGSSAAPTLTSVTPNPLSVGTITVTIAGSGFQTGALVYDSYGSQSNIQTAPTTVTANSITVSIYQGPAATSTFSVKNPGSGYSNTITVPVTAAASGGGTSGSGGSSTYTLTVVNGTITSGAAAGATTASFASGATVTVAANTPPAGEAFQAWTGLSVSNPLANPLTIAMPASNTTVTANFYTPAPVPFPVTTHPRLWITQQDLPRLQSWATSSNVAYQGLQGALGAAIGNYYLAFPGAALGAINPTPANPYPDFGDIQGYTGVLSEENAVILAFNSLIDPSPKNRAQYAQAARNLLMYAMNQAALGQATGAPFRDPSFPIYNRGSFTGHEWPLIVDWIYPILSAADKATIRTVFMTWANDCLNAETTGGDNPGTPGLMNSLALLPNNRPYRMASNNYYLAHARLLTMMSLVLDPADDPSVNPAISAAALGNTLRSYLADATGAWLYEEFAMMGDPAVVAKEYGVPNNPTGAGFGLASGGLPPEGMLYGESFAYVLGQLLALQTSGFNNASYANFVGPQIGMIGAPVWDRYVTGYLSSLTPTAEIFASESYLGSVYQFAGYGDLLRSYVTPDQMAPFALLGLLDQETGTSSHVDAARWYAVNGMPNGAGGLLSRMADPWTWGVTQDLLYYMLLDPTAPAATDPRPTYPTVFYDAPAGRIVAHSDWSSTNTMFDYRASWISINHQDGNGGQFELYRKGEWLTKEMSNYDNGGGGNGATVTYHNTLSLQNWCPACSGIAFQGTDLPAWLNGSQWMEGENAGDPTTMMSTGPGYVYAASNLTNLYNKPDIWTAADAIADISQATRSILWLNNDYIVVYDRATSLNAGLFKRFNLSLVTNPAITGNTATETLPSGQQLFIQTLLPLNPSLTSFNGAANLNPIADLEPTRYIYQVQDPTIPTDTRFLHVLQGADPGVPMAPATYLQSTGGTAFDGAVFASTAVYFPVSNNGAFAGATFSAPAGVHTLFVTGLTPNASYGAGVQVTGAGNLVTVAAGGASLADAAGVLVVNF